jgi:hypothetical protein
VISASVFFSFVTYPLHFVTSVWLIGSFAFIDFIGYTEGQYTDMIS